MREDARPQHAWLERMVGRWEYESEYRMGPDQPPSTSGGSEVVRSLGGLWVVAEGTGQMADGGAVTSIMTLGFDARAERFTGSYIASTMTFLWIYDGTLDADGRELTLNNEGPDFTSSTPKTARYRDIIAFEDDDHRAMYSEALGDDGTWHRFMTSRYRRV